MKKRVIAALILAMLLVSMLPIISASALIGPQYVSTSNGKGLHLRTGPSKDFDIITTIPYGAMMGSTDYYDAAWSYVTYNGYAGYVMTRYLSSTKPTSKPSPTATPSPSSSGISYKNFEQVDYYVTVRPSHASGFVNLRWAPSKSVAVHNIYYAGSLLRVLAQNNTWAQVLDESTGICGFMMRNFLTDAGDGSGS